MEIKKYYGAIRKNVCEICCDSDETGNCTLSKGEICAVENYLPKILELVHSLNCENMEDNYKLLRDEICAHCKASESSDKCLLRDDVNCSLDRYFPIIIETIKKVDSGKL